MGQVAVPGRDTHVATSLRAQDPRLGLRVRGLVVEFPGFQLGPVTLECAPGERVAIVGANGAGKSTMLRAIAGRLSVSRGEVFLAGCRVAVNALAVRQRIGFMPERLRGFEWMTVREHLRFLAAFYPGWDEQYVSELCAYLGLDCHKRLSALSKGMRVKLAFVAAEAFRPACLLLDEPTSGLDPAARRRISRAIREVVRSDGERIVLFSTHLIEDIEWLAERVIAMKDGTIALDRSVTDLRAAARGSWRDELIDVLEP